MLLDEEPISVKAAIPIRANADARRNNGAAYGSRAFAAEPVPRSASTPVPMFPTGIGRRTVRIAMSILAM